MGCDVAETVRVPAISVLEQTAVVAVGAPVRTQPKVEDLEKAGQYYISLSTATVHIFS